MTTTKKKRFAVITLFVCLLFSLSLFSAMAASFGTAGTASLKSDRSWKNKYTVYDTKAYNDSTVQFKMTSRTAGCNYAMRLINSEGAIRSGNVYMSAVNTVYSNYQNTGSVGYYYYASIYPYYSNTSSTVYVTYAINAY